MVAAYLVVGDAIVAGENRKVPPPGVSSRGMVSDLVKMTLFDEMPLAHTWLQRNSPVNPGLSGK